MKGRGMWGAVGWGAGVLALLVGLPLAAAGRLPDPVATHWGAGSDGPDGSMPLWAAVVFPALVWVVVVAAVVFGARRGPRRAWGRAALAFGGVMLAGAQASVVRANLDVADWRQAGDVTGWGVAVMAGVALLAGAGAALPGRRAGAAEPPAAEGPRMEIPDGERLVWLSSAANPWLQLLAGLFALAALGALLAGLAGLAADPWLTAGTLALAALAVLACSSVRARVTRRGLEVAFGPLGYPVRRWAAEDIESARMEVRTAARAGGWGYRINGLGTTVMLRGGECLVVRAKGRDFAVSVDDAARGAALLNSLRVGKG
ncbi:DUF1648 domain-containing protein [Streptomyces sp. 3211.6]|uniref:DUF1648 domain-containing protein n=1 Tax=Streptomyces sp. 3211.6 TaxID=1938845 RepID=UPI00290561FE|nr:DUF1648 domain-containing protein [Streptomyces sp. 3211.6]